MPNMNKDYPILGKDITWDTIDGDVLLAVEFNPYAKVDGKTITSIPNYPYATLTVECTKIPQQATLYVTHKLDFQNLWNAYKVRGIQDSEEVLVFWTKKHYKSGLSKFFSSIMPKLWIRVCKKGAYKLMTDKNYKPEITGEARFLAESPVIEWKPDVLE